MKVNVITLTSSLILSLALTLPVISVIKNSIEDPASVNGQLASLGVAKLPPAYQQQAIWGGSRLPPAYQQQAIWGGSRLPPAYV